MLWIFLKVVINDFDFLQDCILSKDVIAVVWKYGKFKTKNKMSSFY